MEHSGEFTPSGRSTAFVKTGNERCIARSLHDCYLLQILHKQAMLRPAVHPVGIEPFLAQPRKRYLSIAGMKVAVHPVGIDTL